MDAFMTKNEFIKVFPVFRKSSDEFFQELISAASVKNVPAGKQIYAEGDARVGDTDGSNGRFVQAMERGSGA